MEGGFPMLNCLLQHTLRSLCAAAYPDSSTSSKWVYAVFWRILPRNYPPPKWDHGGCLIDPAKANKRNWILVWEDGFCGCNKGRFGADIFFKMTHEVYNFGEGLVGRVASDNSHKWVFRDTQDDPTFTPWNDPQPKAWEAQFSSGIETIAVVSVREGAIQLGSFHKVVEDLNMVMSIQRMFGYLQSIPGIFVIQRPYLPIRYSTTFFDPCNTKRPIQNSINDDHDKHQMMRLKRQTYDLNLDGYPSSNSMYFGDNSGFPLWSMNVESYLPKVGISSQNLEKRYEDVAAAFREFRANGVEVEIEGLQDETIQEMKANWC